MPHFIVADIDGRVVSYADAIWQRTILVLVTIGSDDDQCLPRWRTLRSHLSRDQADVVITRDPFRGAPPYSIIVADQWGEIVFLHHASSTSAMPDDDHIAGWVAHVRMRCPECEGETR